MSDYINVEIPSFTDNMKFMFNYQFGYMYMRYLMWNFAGRQNDIQGYNDHRDGNWITGIKFLDEIRLGSQNNLTSDMLNRSEEHTSELQSRPHLVCRLLLEKKREFATAM